MVNSGINSGAARPGASMAQLVQTEIHAHEAVISSLYLRSQTQEARANPIEESIASLMDSMKKFLHSHSVLMETVRKSDLSNIGGDATFKLACTFNEQADNLRDVLGKIWDIAANVPPKFQKEYCCAAREIERCHEDLEDLVETWCLSADPTLRTELLNTVKSAKEESSNRQTADWREFLASL
jgi:hypothetical protein